MIAVKDGGHLLAVLLNPPSDTSGSRSRKAVERAARVLGIERTVIANLCLAPTRTVVELNAIGNHAQTREAWVGARVELESGMSGAIAILAAWGISGLSGDARKWRTAQIGWLTERAAAAGVVEFWMLGGVPRHPSRWHQYVSDKYGRTSGGTFDERIAQALVEVSLA